MSIYPTKEKMVRKDVLVFEYYCNICNYGFNLFIHQDSSIDFIQYFSFFIDT